MEERQVYTKTLRSARMSSASVADAFNREGRRKTGWIRQTSAPSRCRFATCSLPRDIPSSTSRATARWKWERMCCCRWRPDGVACACQLKGAPGGSITLARWRDELAPQAFDLITGRIVHPSIPAGGAHRAYLVTNGQLEEEVIRAIDDMNAGLRHRGNPELRLHTIVGELLKKARDLGDELLAKRPTGHQGSARVPRGRRRSLQSQS